MMDNPWDEMRRAVSVARELQKAVQDSSGSMGALLVGNLRHCRIGDLCKLKRELRDFDMTTGKWKER